MKCVSCFAHEAVVYTGVKKIMGKVLRALSCFLLLAGRAHPYTDEMIEEACEMANWRWAVELDFFYS